MRKILFGVLLISCLHTHGQKSGRKLVDSLLTAVPAAENDTIKARLYNRIFNELSLLNVDQARQYARMGLDHSKKMKWPKGIAVFQNNLGRTYSDIGNYDSTQFYYNAALATHTRAGDKYNMASTYNNMGTAAANIRADYTKAISYYLNAIQLSEEIRDTLLQAVSLSNAGRIFMIQKNYAKALEFDNKALKLRELKGSPDEVAASLESIGKNYYLTNQLVKAKQCFLQAESLYKSTGNLTGLANIYTSLPLVYGSDYRKVIETRIKAKQLWDEINPLFPDAITNTGNLGITYLDIVRNDTNRLVKYGDIIPNNKKILLLKAKEYLQAAIQLATQNGDIDTKSFFTGALAEVQEYTGDFKNAYYNYKLFKESQDSLFSQENKNKIAEAESRQEIDRKNNEIQIKQLALSKQRRKMWGLIGGLGLLVIIGVLLFRQNQQRKKTNATLMQLNTALDKANKVKAKFFAILSHDLRAPVARLINFLNLQKNDPGLLSPEQAAAHQKKIVLSAEALLENMESMLLWSKSQMDDFKPVNNKVTSASLFDQLNKTFSPVNDVQISYRSIEDIVIHTDENYLLTIMQNLTTNAISAIKSQLNATINWSVKKTNNSVIFTIQDNGPGLPAEVINILKDNTTNLGSKHGFGFHIIKDMAKAINCCISFQSNAEGTQFNLEINN